MKAKPAAQTCHRGLACLLATALNLACGSDSSAGSSANTDAAKPDGGELSSDSGAEPDGQTEESFETLELTVGDFVFDAHAAGPADGELVLLLHGFPTTWFQWRAQLAALAKQGYRAVAPNQRGYSEGARPDEIASYSILLLAQDVLGMADALDRETFHVVGHDWGGAVAWVVAGIAPARVSSLTVLSTPHPDAMAAARSDPDSCQASASAYIETLRQPDVTAQDLASIGTGFDGVSEEAQAVYLQDVITQPDVFAAAAKWYAANFAADMPAPNLGKIGVSTLYLFGTEDSAFCRDTADSTAGYVDGDYRFVPVSGGHWLSETNAELVNRELLDHLGARSK